MKKTGTRILATVLTLCMLLGMAGAASAEPLKITFWNLLTGSDGEKMVEMIEEFNASQSDYVVEGVTLDWDSYYTKLRTSVLGGVAPTFAISHYPYIPALAKEGVIVPLDEYVDKLGMTMCWANQFMKLIAPRTSSSVRSALVGSMKL